MPDYQDEYERYVAACRTTPLSYEDFAAECEAEDAAIARQYDRHVSEMRNAKRYI